MARRVKEFDSIDVVEFDTFLSRIETKVVKNHYLKKNNRIKGKRVK